MCECNITDEQIKKEIDALLESNSIVSLGEVISDISVKLNVVNNSKLYKRVVEYLRDNHSFKAVHPKGYTGSGIYKGNHV